MSITYREQANPQFTSGNDFVTITNYAHSFNVAPKTSQLRWAIAPGTVKRFNNEFQTGNIVPIQNQMLMTDRPLTPGSAAVADSDYIPIPNPSVSYSTNPGSKPPPWKTYTSECEYSRYPTNRRHWL